MLQVVAAVVVVVMVLVAEQDQVAQVTVMMPPGAFAALHRTGCRSGRGPTGVRGVRPGSDHCLFSQTALRGTRGQETGVGCRDRHMGVPGEPMVSTAGRSAWRTTHTRTGNGAGTVAVLARFRHFDQLPKRVLIQAHTHQQRWRLPFRVAWWLLLLPVALLCWSVSQRHLAVQVGGCMVGLLAALFWVALVVGATNASRTPAGAAQVLDSRPIAQSPQPAPSLTDQAGAALGAPLLPTASPARPSAGIMQPEKSSLEARDLRSVADVRSALDAHGFKCHDYKPGSFNTSPAVQEGGQCIIDLLAPDPHEGSYTTGVEIYRTPSDRAAVDRNNPGVLSGSYHVDGPLWRVDVLFNPDLGARIATALGGNLIQVA